MAAPAVVPVNQELPGSSQIDYKVILAIIYLGWFLGTLAMFFIMAFVIYDPWHWFQTWAQQKDPTPIPTVLSKDNLGPFVVKLFGFYSVPLGVILGGIFGTANKDSGLATRSNVVLLYAVSNGWGAIMLISTFFSVVAVNIFDYVGTGAAFLTTIPLSAIFTKVSAAGTPDPPPQGTNAQ